jgi:purine-binding chemotaxis protein CheW
MNPAPTSREQRDHILRQRAQAAARVPPAPERVQPLQVVEFLMAYERYGLESTWVREVLALRELTPLPGTPSFVAGIVNVRGRVLPVVDLKAFFDLSRKGMPDLNRVLVVGEGDVEFGLLVDAVTGVVNVQPEQLQAPLPTMTGVRQEYLRGLTPDRLALLDGACIVNDPRIVVGRDPPD